MSTDQVYNRCPLISPTTGVHWSSPQQVSTDQAHNRCLWSMLTGVQVTYIQLYERSKYMCYLCWTVLMLSCKFPFPIRPVSRGQAGMFAHWPQRKNLRGLLQVRILSKLKMDSSSKLPSSHSALPGGGDPLPWQLMFERVLATLHGKYFIEYKDIF